MWSRSRRLGLETVSRRTNVSSRSRLGQSAQRLGLVSVSDLRLGSRLGLDPKRLGSRGGSRTISSRRDVSCRRAQLNYNSPMKAGRPMHYSVGLDGYCLINNVFIFFHIGLQLQCAPERLAMLFLKVSKLHNKYAVWPRKKWAVIIAITRLCLLPTNFHNF